MAEESDAMKLTVNQVPEAKLINVKLTVEESGVINLGVMPAPKERPTSVACTAVVPDARIALIGLIVVVVVLNMMDIVQLASNVAFQRMHAVTLSILIPKKLW